MTPRIFIITVFFSGSLLGQPRQCGCSSDSLLTKYTVNCKSTALKNGSKLYWQFNCDKIWLTLHTKNKKIVIDHVPIQYYNLTYRLGFHLVKEFENSLLFRGGCPANGPCDYTLIDKTSGQKMKELGQIVDSPQKDYQYDFVIYLSKANNFLNIYFPDKKKLLQRHVKKHDFFYTVPIDQFDGIKLDKNILTIAYETARNEEVSHKKKITLDIKKYSR